MLETVIALHAALVHATEHRLISGEMLLVVRRSLAVIDTDPQLKEVTTYLAGHCSALLTTTRGPDKDMIMGSSEVSTVRVWATCPGPSHQHQCAALVTSSIAA